MIRCSGRGASVPSDDHSHNQVSCELARNDRAANGKYLTLRDSGSDSYKEAAAHLAHAAALIQNVETSNERLGWLIEECLQLVKRRAV